ncbi:MAG: hypothetical protein ACM3OF_13470 [Gemmatimonas sp.]
MRKLIIATAALAFVSSTALAPSIAFAQDKGAAASTDTTKAAPSKMSKKKMMKKKKSAKKSSANTMKKQ